MVQLYCLATSWSQARICFTSQLYEIYVLKISMPLQLWEIHSVDNSGALCFGHQARVIYAQSISHNTAVHCSTSPYGIVSQGVSFLGHLKCLWTSWETASYGSLMLTYLIAELIDYITAYSYLYLVTNNSLRHSIGIHISSDGQLHSNHDCSHTRYNKFTMP